MKRPTLWIMAGVLAGVSACNYSVGECWLKDDGTGSDPGGGTIVPNGGGGGSLGDAPPMKPQDSSIPPADCNMVTQSPCIEKCLADYEATAGECGTIASDAQRKACQDKAHASYNSCKDACQQTSNSDCDEKYQDCQANGPSSCLKNVGGKSLCQRCWERCNAGDAPSGQCRSCKF